MGEKTETILGRVFTEYESDLYENLMHSLVSNKLVPATSRDVIKARLEIAEKLTGGMASDSPEVYKWLHLTIDTSTGIASYHGNIKVMHNPVQLIGIKPNTEYSPRGALRLDSEEYEQAWAALEGRELKRSDLEKIGFGMDMTKDQVRNHPVFQDLAGDSLSQYVDFAFDYLEKNGYGNTGMHVNLAPEEDFPTMRFLSLDGLDGRFGVNAIRSFRHYGKVRLIGLGDEFKPEKTPENKEDDSIEDNQDEGLEEEFRRKERQNFQSNSTINKSDPKGMLRYVLNSMREMKEFEIYGQFYGIVETPIVDEFARVRQLKPESIRQYDAGILSSVLDGSGSTSGVETLREFITVLRSNQLPFRVSIERGYIPIPEKNYRMLVERLEATCGS